jgi:hypothetical protein
VFHEQRKTKSFQRNVSLFRIPQDEKAIMAASSPIECKFKAKTRIEKIDGENRHGWLAEDSYKTNDKSASTPESCGRYLKANRCVRMAIGNSKFSATMAQYCLTGNPEDFDLDAGLSYDIFLKIIKTIRFVGQ